MKYDIRTISGREVIEFTKEELMTVYDERYNRTLSHLLALNNPWFTTDDKDILYLEDKFWGSVLKILATRGKIETESKSILMEKIGEKYVYELYFESLLNKLYEMKKVFISINGIYLYLESNPNSEFVRKRKYRLVQLVPYILEKYVDSQLQTVWDILQYKVGNETVLHSLLKPNVLENIRKKIGEERFEVFISNLENTMKKVNKVTVTNIRRSEVLRLLSQLQQQLTVSTV